MGGRPFTSGSTYRFKRFIDDVVLIDVGYVGFPFTWNNHQAGRANIQDRLDKGFENSAWQTLFLNATIHCVQGLSSYHKPLLLSKSFSLHPPQTFQVQRYVG